MNHMIENKVSHMLNKITIDWATTQLCLTWKYFKAV